MVAGKQVNPRNVKDKKMLFDDGEFSACVGDFFKSGETMGIRWNIGTSGNGYPVQGNNPVWFCVPEYLELSLLKGLQGKLEEAPYRADAEKHKRQVAEELKKRE